MPDGRIDGHFVIISDLSSSLKDELGLTADDCTKMGSIWNEVLNEANNTANYKSDTNNQTNNSNFQVGTIILFTKESWNKIVKLVNDTLGTSIQAEDADEYYDNINLGNSAIVQFNQDHPNVESATYYGSLADYLRTYGNDTNRLAELKQNPRFAELTQYIEDYQAGKISIEELEQRAETLGVGDDKTSNSLDCADRANEISDKFNQQGIKSIVLNVADLEHFMVDGGRGGHTFCVIGLNENADTTDPSTWGKNAVIVDAWIGKSLSVDEAIEYYREFFRYDEEHIMTFGNLKQINDKLKILRPDLFTQN